MIFSLGGFAENEKVIDGSYEEYIAFNYCTAENYHDALYGEAWEEINEIDYIFIKNISLWLQYGEHSDETIKKITTGEFLTYRNRTFIDAIIEEKKINLALNYIILGNKDPRLLLLYMLESKETSNYNILNIISFDNKESYISYLKELFHLIEQKYNALPSNESRLEMLKTIKPYIENIKYPKEYGNINITHLGNYQWVRKLIK